MAFNNIVDKLFSVKAKLTDAEYKEMVEEVERLKNAKEEDIMYRLEGFKPIIDVRHDDDSDIETCFHFSLNKVAIVKGFSKKQIEHMVQRIEDDGRYLFHFCEREDTCLSYIHMDDTHECECNLVKEERIKFTGLDSYHITRIFKVNPESPDDDRLI